MQRQPIVIEKTDKTWKAAQLIGIAATLISVFGGLAASQMPGDTDQIVCCVIFALGLIFGLGMWIIGRFGAWWFHG